MDVFFPKPFNDDQLEIIRRLSRADGLVVQGPPGTGKTICAEAVAHALGMKLLVVDYAEAESMWVGETPKNIARLFRAAADEDAVLFFDEADAIALRRSTGGAIMVS